MMRLWLLDLCLITISIDLFTTQSTHYSNKKPFGQKDGETLADRAKELTKIPTAEDFLFTLRSQGYGFYLPRPFSSWLSMNINHGGNNEHMVLILTEQQHHSCFRMFIAPPLNVLPEENKQFHSKRHMNFPSLFIHSTYWIHTVCWEPRRKRVHALNREIVTEITAVWCKRIQYIAVRPYGRWDY